MIGIYLSGTGNTKHCVEKLIGLLDKTAAALPLEDADITEQIKNNDTVTLSRETVLFGQIRKYYALPQWAPSAVTARAADCARHYAR